MKFRSEWLVRLTKLSCIPQEIRGGKDEKYENTLDGSVDFRGRPAVKGRTGGWVAASLLLGNICFRN